MIHKYNNTVILSNGGEHGKRVIEFWRKQGVDVDGLDDPGEGYYGLINGVFDWYWPTQVKQANAKIIELPETNQKIIDLSNVEGVEMMVSFDEKEWEVSKVVAKFEKCYITNEGSFVHAKPIEVKKVTMQEIEKAFGCKVEIVKEVKS